MSGRSAVFVCRIPVRSPCSRETNDTAEYVFEFINPATYTITAESHGAAKPQSKANSKFNIEDSKVKIPNPE